MFVCSSKSTVSARVDAIVGKVEWCKEDNTISINAFLDVKCRVVEFIHLFRKQSSKDNISEFSEIIVGASALDVPSRAVSRGPS